MGGGGGGRGRGDRFYEARPCSRHKEYVNFATLSIESAVILPSANDTLSGRMSLEINWGI